MKTGPFNAAAYLEANDQLKVYLEDLRIVMKPMPHHIAISQLDDGKWGWDVTYEDEKLDQGGVTDGLGSAIRAMYDALSGHVTETSPGS